MGKHDGVTDLHLAAHTGDMKSAHRLISSRKVSVNQATTAEGITPLFIACQNGFVEVARLLLDKGGEINAATTGGATPLLVACHHGHTEVAQLLLDKGAAIDAAVNKGPTPLLLACQGGFVELVRLLLDKGGEINTAMKATPLLVACLKGKGAVLRLLLDSGASANACSDIDTSPLHVACNEGHKDVVLILLERGATIDKLKDGTTAVDVAANAGHLAVVKMLVKAGACFGAATAGKARTKGHEKVASPSAPYNFRTARAKAYARFSLKWRGSCERLIVSGVRRFVLEQAKWLDRRAAKQQQRVDKGVEKFCAVCFKKGGGGKEAGALHRCSPVGS